jgi:hypothetical protein
MSEPHQEHHHRPKTALPLSPKVQSGLVVLLVVVVIFNLTWLGLRALVAYRMKNQYVETTGMVVDVAQLPAENQNEPDQHYPVVEFVTQEGKSVVFKAKVGSEQPSYQPGESVIVLYNKERPYVALLDVTRK